MWLTAAGGGESDAIQHFSAPEHVQIIFALIAIVATSIGALVYTIKNNKLGRDINKAVNNVGPGEHHLIDLIKQIKDKQDEFDKKWGNLPDDLDDAVGVVEVLRGMDRRISGIQGELRAHIAELREHAVGIQGELREHVAELREHAALEIDAKYKTPGS